MKLSLIVNGATLETQVSPSTRLLDVLRRAGNLGVKQDNEGSSG